MIQARIQRLAARYMGCIIESRFQYLDPLISCHTFVLATLQFLLPTGKEVINAYLDVISTKKLVSDRAYLQFMAHIAIYSTV